MGLTKASPDSFGTDVIADAALEILKEQGPDALSLRRVGEALGTSHVTVYRRCGNFDGLLDVCADHIAAGFPEFPDQLDWASATQMRFEAAYEMWAEYADLILLMRGRAWLGQNMLRRFYEPAMKTLVDAGLPVPDAARMFSVLYRLTIGSVISTRANHWTPWESRDAVEKFGVQRFPTLAKVTAEVDQSDNRGAFSDTLRRLIIDLGPLRPPAAPVFQAARRDTTPQTP